MAARKSCTHLTWAEAKNKSGVGGQKKNKEVLRKQNHGQVLANKIIAKGGGEVASAENKKLKKQYRKQEEKAAAIAAQRLEEREQKRLAALQETKPYDRAKEKFGDRMKELRKKSNDNDNTNDPPSTTSSTKLPDGMNVDEEEIQMKIAECKQMQLDEIMALEAMIPEEDFVICNAGDVATLREKLEDYESNDEARSWIAKQSPAISYYIKLHVDDYREDGDDATNSNRDMDLNALILLRVTLPPLYLNSDGGGDCQTPIWEFVEVLVTDKNFFCSADKPLESMAWLDENKLRDAMNQEAQDTLLPYPCVYELAVTWFSENVFSYLNIHSHLLATT